VRAAGKIGNVKNGAEQPGNIPSMLRVLGI